MFNIKEQLESEEINSYSLLGTTEALYHYLFIDEGVLTVQKAVINGEVDEEQILVQFKMWADQLQENYYPTQGIYFAALAVALEPVKEKYVDDLLEALIEYPGLAEGCRVAKIVQNKRKEL